nr:hypothetical protein [Halomonas elongata]
MKLFIDFSFSDARFHQRDGPRPVVSGGGLMHAKQGSIAEKPCCLSVGT